MQPKSNETTYTGSLFLIMIILAGCQLTSCPPTQMIEEIARSIVNNHREYFIYPPYSFNSP